MCSCVRKAVKRPAKPSRIYLHNKDNNMVGKVDTYFPLRGFGFLSSTGTENGTGKRQSHFFHVSQIIFGDPTPGASVEFEIGPQEKLDKTAPAINVKIGGAL